jgi:hypothetical protein
MRRLARLAKVAVGFHLASHSWHRSGPPTYIPCTRAPCAPGTALTLVPPLPSPSRRRRQRHRLHLAPPCPRIVDVPAPGVAPLPRLGGRGQVFVRPFARLHFAGEENHKVCQSLLFPSCCAKRSTQTLLS